MAPKLFRLPILIFVVVFAVSITLTQYLAYQQYKISREKQRAELIHEAAGVKDRFRNILFNDIAAANTLAIIYKQYGVPAKFDSIARQILQTSRYAEALQITENGIVRNAYPDALYKGAIGTNINADPVRKAEEARAVDRKDIYFAGPRRLRFGDTGILGKVPIITNNRVIAVATVLTRLPAIKKALEPGKGDKNKFVYELLKSNRNDTSLFPLSFAKPAVKSEYRDIEIPEGDWLLRVSYGQGYTADKFNYELSGLGVLFSFIIALLAYRKAQEPYKLNTIIDEKTAQLAKSEEYFRTLIENASDAIYLADNTGNFIDLSESMCKMLGYSKEELMQINFSDIIDPENLKTTPIERPARPNQPIFRERTFITRDGGKVEVEIHGQRLDKGTLMGVARDVTERKRMDAELREAELKFRTVAEKSTLGVYITQNKKFLYANPRFAEIFGYTRQELMDLPDGIIDTIYAEESRAMIREKIRARDAGETEGAHYEAIGIKKDGTRIDVEFYGNRVTINGEPATIGTTLDISTRKQVEEALRSSEQKYKMLFDSNPSPLTMVAKDDLSFIAVNDAVANLYGYEKDELLRMSIKELIPDEDLLKLQKRFQMDVTGTTDFGIIRQVKRDRSIINVQIIAHDFIFEDRPVRLSLIIDITERLKAEESLRESEARFRSAFEDSAIGMGLTSVDKGSMGRWLKVNRSLCEMLGYTEDELLSLTFMQITHPDDLARDLAAQNRILQGESDTYRLEKRYIHKNGSFIWINLNVSIVRDKDNQPIYLVAQIENITEKVESQIKFQDLVENFIVGVYIHQNGKIVYVNPRLMEESGFAEEDLIGRPIEEFIYKDDLDFVKNITEAREKEHLDTVRFEARFIKNDGQLIWFEVFGSRTVYQGAPALMGTMVNVSERKAAYEELTKSEANLKSIFETTDVSYLLLNTNYDIVALNQQMKDVYVTVADIELNEGDNLIESLLPEKREGTKAIYDKVVQTNKAEDYESSYFKDGKYTHFMANVKPIHDGKKTIGVCISAMDITELKNALERLEETNENLKKHAKELAISNAELEQFAFVASHDLQEPLRMVTSFMTQLEKKYGDVVDEKGRQYIRFAVDGAKRMRQIILDLLDFSRVGSLDDDTEDVDFNKLMNEIQALYRRQIEELHAKINFENLPVLHIHKTPVRQVFQNLVGNSLKYHRTKVAPVIDISCTETKTHYQFSVKDNGIGIAREYFDKIFIIFQRLHNKDEYSGTGMGLAITKKIVESLGGKIWLESEEGQGSTFYFTLLKK